MKKLPAHTFRKVILSIALLFLAGGIGYRLGERHIGVRITPDRSVIIEKDPPDDLSLDFSLFWDVWRRVLRYHIDAKELDKQQLIWGAIRGMVRATGDPYSSFLSPEENEDFKEDIGGTFEGIGAQLGLKEDRIIVVAPLVGHPAESAGLRASDWILEVDGEETAGWSIQEAVTKIRGPKGTSVTLNVLHEGSMEPEDITIVRDTINVPFVDSWVKQIRDIDEISGTDLFAGFSKEPKIAYIQLLRFGDNTNSEWDDAVSDILDAIAQNGSLKGLILDLRNNPGGYLDGSVYIASEFLKDGVVVSQENANGTIDDFHVNRKGNLLSVPLVVVVNKGSASASEIVAGALQDYERARIVGDVTFGKGSIQTPQELPGGASLHITTAAWLTPNGQNINDEGIVPDYEVELTSYEATEDAQLAKAVELLLQ